MVFDWNNQKCAFKLNFCDRDIELSLFRGIGLSRKDIKNKSFYCRVKCHCVSRVRLLSLKCLVIRKPWSIRKQFSLECRRKPFKVFACSSTVLTQVVELVLASVRVETAKKDNSADCSLITICINLFPNYTLCYLFHSTPKIFSRRLIKKPSEFVISSHICSLLTNSICKMIKISGTITRKSDSSRYSPSDSVSDLNDCKLPLITGRQFVQASSP